MLELAFHPGLGHIVLNFITCGLSFWLSSKAWNQKSSTLFSGPMGKHSRSPNKAQKFVILFKHHHQSAELYFPQCALCIVDKASFDRTSYSYKILIVLDRRDGCSFSTTFPHATDERFCSKSDKVLHHG